MEKVTVEQAAAKVGWSAEFLRATLRNDRCPFGVAVQKDPKKLRWCYKINSVALEKYLKGEIFNGRIQCQ